MRLRGSRYFGAALGCLALVACDSDEEQVTTAEDSAAYVATDEGGTAADFIAHAGDRVFFDLNKHTLSPEGIATLEKQVEWLTAHPDKEIVVEGHCDDRGTAEYNLALGERRAHQVVSFLVGKGIAESRIRGVSYGKDRPIEIPNADREEFWRQNRVAIAVIQ
ncbi:MAG: OmpA family protein [Holosporales bacterium]|jgi:peptidoglycan-associated lipoprotein|nr:OmpA family protein [Holosporales bacterium]